MPSKKKIRRNKPAAGMRQPGQLFAAGAVVAVVAVVGAFLVEWRAGCVSAPKPVDMTTYLLLSAVVGMVIVGWVWNVLDDRRRQAAAPPPEVA